MAIINGTTSDDVLVGTSANDTLDGGAGNDWLQGGAGSDTYLFDFGSGQDIIDEYDATGTSLDVVQFGAGVLPANVTASHVGSDLVLSINGTTDTLRISNYFTVIPVGSSYWDPATGTYLTATQEMRPYAIEEIRFFDGTVWTPAQMNVINGTSGDDWLYGSMGADVINGLGGNDQLFGYGGDDTLDGGAGNDILDGYTGNDTYLFDIGGGQDIIRDYDSTGGSLDVVQFGAGVRPADVTVIRGGTTGNDLLLSINGTTDTLTIQDYYRFDMVVTGYDQDGFPIFQQVRANTVEEVRFADGTVWTPAYLDAACVTIVNGTAGDDWLPGTMGNDLITGLAGNDTLVGDSGNDTLDGGAGNDQLVGNMGNDTYLFDIGGGQDVINDYDWTNSSLDVVQFGAGVLPGNVTAARSTINSNDLVLSINGTTDSLTIANYFAVNSTFMGMDPVTGMPIFQYERANTVEEVRFADGTVWTRAQLDVINGTAGDDILQGSAINDVINGLAGNDTLVGNAGNDTLDGGAGNDVLVGDMGNDTYLFDIGGGQDVINEWDMSGGSSMDVVQFGAGVLPSNVTVTRGGWNNTDLVLSINGTTDSLTIANYFAVNSTYMGTDPVTGIPIFLDIRANTVEEVRFADGTVWTQAQLDVINGTAGDDILQGNTGNDVMNGLAGNDQLMASAGNDTLDGGAGNDVLVGDWGNDTYLFDIGGGQDVIYDYDTAAGSLDVVQFGAGVRPADVTATRGSNGYDLVLSINGTTDSLTIANYFTLIPAGSSYWDPATGSQLIATQDMRPGVVEEIRFADGTVWTQAQLDVINGTAGDDYLYGTVGNDVINGLAGNDYLQGDAGNDTLDGGAGSDWLGGGVGNDVLDGGSGNDVLDGYAGSDTYLFDIGGGQDTIHNYNATGNDLDVLQFGAAVLPSKVTIARSTVNSDDLVLSINGTTDSVTIANYFTVRPAGTLYWDPVAGITRTATQDMRSYAIEQIRFADGTVLDSNAIAQITNRPPVAAADNVTVNEDGAAVISQAQLLANDTDPDGGTLNISGFDAVTAQGNAVTQDANGNFVLGIGNRYQSLGAGQTATDSFTYTITDAFGATSTATVNVTITGSNDAPIVAAVIASQQASEDAAFSFTVPAATFADIDSGDVLTYMATLADGSALPSWLTFDAATQTFSGTPANGDVGSYSVVVKATDIGGLSTSGTFAINVANVNDAPVASAVLMAQSITQGQAFNYTLPTGTFTDVDIVSGDELTYSATLADGGALPAWLTFDVATRTFSGTPGVGDVASLNVVVTATDLGGLSANNRFTLAVNAPVFWGSYGDDNLTGTMYDDTMMGLDGNDTLNGGAGNDWLVGGAGSDTYLFGIGSGQDVISNYDTTANKLDVVQFGSGVLPADVSVARNTYDLVLSINGTTDSLTLRSYFSTSLVQGEIDPATGIPICREVRASAVQEVRFADGTVWTQAQLDTVPMLGSSGNDSLYGSNVADTINGNAGNDVLYGNGGNDILNGGAGNDILYGETGNDTYLFDIGGGQDIINEDQYYTTSENVDAVQFGSGVLAANVTFARSAVNKNDLVISINGTTDSLTIRNYFWVIPAGCQYWDPTAGAYVTATQDIRPFGVEWVRFADGTILDYAAIAGLADRPPVAVSDDIAINEDGVPVISQAQLLANDTDPHNGTLSISGFDAVTAQGNAVTQDANGNFVLGIGNRYQSLGAGQTATDSFSYTITDAFGATSTATVNITIRGSNDGPVVAAAIASQQANEDAAFSFAVPAGSFTDIDNGDVLTYSATMADGTALPSWLTFDAVTQTFSGTPCNGDVGNYSVTVTATDTGGLSASSTFAVNVANVNDSPTVSMVPADQTTLEDAAFSFTIPAGTFNDVDFIHGDSLTYAATLADGAALPAWLSFDAATQTLSGTPANGDVGNISVRVTATDMAGASVSSTFALNVQNVNDAPIASADSVATNEDAMPQIAVSSLLANDTDPDASDTLALAGFDALSANGNAVTQDALGNLVLDIGNRYQSLAVGQTATDSFSYTVTDAAGATSTATVTIAINGVNDGPITQADAISLSEDSAMAATGNVLSNDSDVDQGTVLAVGNAGTLLGNYGSLVLNADGTYSYALDNALVQSLGAGQSATETFTYQATDGIASTPATLTVTIIGSNDAAVAVADTAVAQEDLGIVATGNVLANDSDVDQGTSLSVANAGVFAGNYGQLVLNADGTYTYALDNASQAVQLLAAGQVVTETFMYQATDGLAVTPSTLTISITGSNDAPVVVADTAALQEDLNVTVTGNVLANDSDADQGTLLSVSPSGTSSGLYGQLTLLADGSYTYALYNNSLAIQSLAEGETVTESFVYQAIDGMTGTVSTISFTISGSNDAPVVVADIAAVAEDLSIAATGNVLANDSDVDRGTSLSVANAGVFAGTYGQLVLNADGTYTYGLDNASPAVQSLVAGQVVTETFTYQATDGLAVTSSTLTIRITGSNDAPVVVADTAALQEDLNVTVSGNVLANDSDVDQGAALTVFNPGTLQSGYGQFTLAADGTYAYTLNSNAYAVQSLAEGQTVTDAFVYQATDGMVGTSSTITFTITGTNDAPTVQADSVSSLQEDLSITATGNVLANDSDVDQGNSLSVANAGVFAGTYGQLVLNADGSYTYALDNASQAVQSLAAGQVVTETFTYQATDGLAVTPSTLTISITGTNDAPVVVADTAAVQEDLSITVMGNVLANDSDVDQGTVLSVGQTGTWAGQCGQFTLLADGSYTYALYNNSPAVQSLAQGETVTDAFVYQATDGASGPTSTITFTVTGTNDAPVVASAIADQQASEDALFSFTIPAGSFTDVDHGNVLAYAATMADGTALPSWLVFDAVTQTFSGMPGNGDVGNYSVTVTATDAAGLSASSTFVLGVTNVNDAPTVSVALADQAAQQDATFSFTVPAGTFDDVDFIHGDSLSYSVALADGTALPAWLTFDAATQTFSGTPANADVGSINVRVTATDMAGASVSTTFALNVQNVNDAPIVASAIAAQQTSQDAPFSFTIPAGSFTDVDAGDILAYSATSADGAALPSWLVFDAATQTFSGTPANGDVGSYTVLIKATDLAGLSASTTFTIDVANVNDAPVASVAFVAQSATQGQAFTYALPAGSFTDVDQGDVLTYSATLADGTALPAWLTFNAATLTFSGMPGVGDVANLNVVVTATDIGGLSANNSFSLAVSAPVITGTAGADSLTGTVYDDAMYGLAGNDTLNGGAGNDILDGGAGADTMKGGLGNDTYIVDSTSDVVTENAGEGTDTTLSSITYTLKSNVENLTLSGTAAINGTGNSLNNVLDGSLNTAANVLTGGAGNDTYILGAGDTIVEGLGAGTDTVMTSATYTLGSNLENLTLTGTAAVNGTGNSSNNTLIGNSANNVLNGRTGADTMIGGAGDDTYVVDNSGDVVTENVGEGVDLVQSSISYTLAANVENLTLTGSSTIKGTGNALDNVLDGSLNSAANVLTGGAGNDTYILSAGDTIVEGTGAGTDTVMTSATYTLGTNLENLTLTGTSAVNGTGNSADNILVGNAAANTLSGGTGNDLLNGALGNDTLNGDAGNDILQGGDGNDTLADTAGANLLDGGAGDDSLTGNTGNEMFAGGTGNDTINTGNGADIVAFNRGDGVDIVNGGIGSDNTITLGGGINYADLALSKVNNDLILEVGGGEQITLANWYNTTANYKSVIDLQVMADAMATFDPASSDPLLNQAVHNFDFAAIVNAFDQANGGSATFMHWSATNAMLAAHLSGSDTAAIGGDLAHQYGTNGSLTGMSLTAAQAALNDPQFGAGAQTLQPLQGLQGGAVTL